MKKKTNNKLSFTSETNKSSVSRWCWIEYLSIGPRYVATIRYSKNGTTVRIEDIFVSAEFRRQGLATRVFKNMLRNTKAKEVFTSAATRQGRGWLKHHGFKFDEQRLEWRKIIA